MGQPDVTMKSFMNHDDVFADIINNSIFHGKKVVKSTDLKLTNTETQYKGNRKYHSQYQDLSRFWVVNDVILARFSLENQMGVRYREPVKLIGYDGAAYGVQITNDDGKDQGKVEGTYPCISIVLYYGMEPWDGPMRLHTLLHGKWADYLKQFTPDYRMNFVPVAFLSPEELKTYDSDFWIIADYLVQKKRNNGYVPSDRDIEHPEQLFPMMTAVSGRDWENEAIRRMIRDGKKVNMVSAYAEVEAKAKTEGINIGREQMKSAYADIETKAKTEGINIGRAEGINIGREQMKSAYANIEIKARTEGIDIGRAEGETTGERRGRILAYHEMNVPVSDIAGKIGCSEDEVRKVIGSSMN